MALDPVLMRSMSMKTGVIWGNPSEKGFERIGEDNTTLPCNNDELIECYQGTLKAAGIADEKTVPQEIAELMKDMLRDAPYIKGAWMNKFQGKNYLQYASPETQFNVY